MKFILYSFYLFLVLLVSTQNSFSNLNNSETASISGYVIDSLNKETLIGATVSLEGTKLGAKTNKSGYYSISNIKAGTYTIRASYLGYELYKKKISLQKSEELRLDFFLKMASSTTKNVYVEADKIEDKSQINISKVNIPIQQIKEMRIGGESDIFRSLQMLPGILTSSQLSSGLYIRGGSPDQNLVLLDGAAVYNPTHLFGFISSFNSEAVKDVELIKGGFPAEYGGRMSAVLNITQRDGNKEKVEGMFSLGLITSKLSLDGPSPIGDGSWFLGGRTTYFNLVKKAITEDPVNPLPDFGFYDVNAKITQNFGDNDKIFLSFFKSKDALDYSSFGLGISMQIGNTLGSLKWTHIFNPKLFMTTLVSTSEYMNNFNGDNSGYKFLVNNSINDATFKSNFEWFNSDELTTKFGVEVNYFQFDYLSNFTGDTRSTPKGTGSGTTNITIYDYNASVFAQTNYQLDSSFSVQTGLRGSEFVLANQFVLDPRLAFRYQLAEDMALKFSWGIYHQNLKLATNPNFSFFDTWLSTDSSLHVSKAIHYIFSYETKPFEDWDLNFDVYYKTMDHITEINQTPLKIDKASDALFEGFGKSYGFEVFLQRKVGDLTGWLGYAYGYVVAQFDSINRGAEFRPKYDRRNDFKVVLQYKINDKWEAGSNFIFQTGQSYTGVTSIGFDLMPDQNLGKTINYPSQRYGLRLPPSHQLNANVSYKTTVFGQESRIILDIFNVYNRRDILTRVYRTIDGVTSVTDIKLLPILPTISFEMKF